VNVLIYAFWGDAPQHEEYRAWVERMLRSEAAYGVSDLVLSGFVRVVTHPRALSPPSSTAKALSFADAVRSQPHAVPVQPGTGHWPLFSRLCRDTGAKGNLVADAYLAALAIESGSEWITTDRDYSRFPGLRWRHPLAD
jgi:toxin-antitoxin system PIN domain toxin